MSFLSNLADIHTFIFDVDGVLTNGDVLVQDNGQLLRQMNTKDGYAIKTALNTGFRVVIITGGNSLGVKLRLMGLGVAEKDIHLGAHDKRAVLRRLVQEDDLDLAHAVYMGDDLPDYAPMRLVLIATCPNDAVPEIQQIAHYCSPIAGGKGCARDIIEKVLRVQEKWVKLDVVDL
jgi:3-deoxy-D-manno-octulosonate 8-phosphate phosphatase (KDO 8-P phosphatase)